MLLSSRSCQIGRLAAGPVGCWQRSCLQQPAGDVPFPTTLDPDTSRPHQPTRRRTRRLPQGPPGRPRVRDAHRHVQRANGTKLRREEPLNAKDKALHEQALVGVLRTCTTTRRRRAGGLRRGSRPRAWSDDEARPGLDRAAAGTPGRSQHPPRRRGSPRHHPLAAPCIPEPTVPTAEPQSAIEPVGGAPAPEPTDEAPATAAAPPPASPLARRPARADARRRRCSPPAPSRSTRTRWPPGSPAAAVEAAAADPGDAGGAGQGAAGGGGAGAAREPSSVSARPCLVVSCSSPAGRPGRGASEVSRHLEYRSPPPQPSPAGEGNSTGYFRMGRGR